MERLQLLKALEQAGCQLAVNVPVLSGTRTMMAHPDQALRLLQDKQTAYGELMGLSRTEYVEWLSSEGSVYCSATTQKGNRCRNAIVGASFLEPAAWRAVCESGGYCTVHGG